MNDTQMECLESVEGGGVASALGFKAAGVHAGFRRDPLRLDLALVEADELCPAAGVFTQNVFCAAPVLLSKQHLGPQNAGLAKAIIINSGTANAATGDSGMEAACKTADMVAEAAGCLPEEVLVASTGVIGQQLPLAPFESGVPALQNMLSRQGGSDAAHAIMTTDTVAKECAVRYSSAVSECAGMQVSVGGMVKGSGMIMPDMATMIAVITTDAPIDASDLHEALLAAVKKSFNRVTVDSDTSTNDTCFLMASGKAPGAPAGFRMKKDMPAFDEFRAALDTVCITLARAIASDGEGATKLVTVNVRCAADEADADTAARAVANSPLVKTAIAGHDANWGRIAAALGKSGAVFRQEDTDIDIMGIPVCRKGLPVDFDEEDALHRFEDSTVTIDVSLGAGGASATIWTCDFTHEYITINGDYRT